MSQPIFLNTSIKTKTVASPLIAEATCSMALAISCIALPPGRAQCGADFAHNRLLENFPRRC